MALRFVHFLLAFFTFIYKYLTCRLLNIAYVPVQIGCEIYQQVVAE